MLLNRLPGAYAGKYADQLERQYADVLEFRRDESLAIPEDVDFLQYAQPVPAFNKLRTMAHLSVLLLQIAVPGTRGQGGAEQGAATQHRGGIAGEWDHASGVGGAVAIRQGVESRPRRTESSA